MLTDLAIHQCAHLLITGVVAKGLNSTVVRQLTGQRLTEERNPLAEEWYDRSGSSHNARIFMVKRRRSTLLVVHIDRLHQTHESQESSPEVDVLLQRLDTLNLQTEFNFDFMFTLGPRATRGMFPVRLPIFGNLKMDEIRGFKGVKFQATGKRIKYELSIESPELKDLYVNVEFSRKQVFHSELIDQALREAVGVVRDIIPESEWSN